VSIHDGVWGAALSGCAIGGEIGCATGVGVPADLPRPTTKVCPQVVH
jgi:hypothetical protein